MEGHGLPPGGERHCMRKKYIIFSAIAVALVFAVSVGGCNRDSSRTAMRSNKNRQNQPVRPAEVLSASAFRPAPRAPQPLPPPVVTTQYDNYAMIPPAPMQPVVASLPTVSPALAMAQPTMYSAPVYASAAPVVYTLPEPTVRPAAPAVVVAMAPIPELEPARSYRLPTRRTGNRPVAEVMISERAPISANRQEVIRALAPIEVVPVAASQPTPQAWVASPMTAMTTSRAGF